MVHTLREERRVWICRTSRSARTLRCQSTLLQKNLLLFCGLRAPLRDVRKAVRRPPGKQPCLFPERRHIQCSFCAAFCQGLSMRRGCGRKQRLIGCALHFSPAIKKAPHPEGYGASGSGRRIRIGKLMFFPVKCRIVRFRKYLKIQVFSQSWYSHAQPCETVFGVFVGVKTGAGFFQRSPFLNMGSLRTHLPYPFHA